MYGWSAIVGPTGATRSRCSWLATTCPTTGTTSSGTPRPSGCAISRRREPADLPLVLVPGGSTLRSPSTLQVAGALGLHTTAQQPLYDVCIVGGGPAGLAAAVYAASEGLSAVIVEREAPGGQAGQSAAIENYLGFPKGLSGSDLAQRALAQVSRFGAELVLARDVAGFEARGPVRAVLLDGSGEIEARALIVATGVSYRQLTAAGLAELTGRGVYYGVNASEASQCTGDEVYIVGAANSAGQAALNLSRFAKRVVLVVRAASLVNTMSQYLIARLEAARQHHGALSQRGGRPPGATVTSRPLTLADRPTGAHRGGGGELAVHLHRRLAAYRMARAGRGPRRQGLRRHRPGPHRFGARIPGWPLDRPPYALETSVPGVFAAGDVRLDSMKRVASAVGEGAMSVYLVHRYLATSDAGRRSSFAGHLRRTDRRSARRADRRRHRGGDRAGRRSCSARVSTPTSGGCWWTVRSTSSGTSAARTPWWPGWTCPDAGPAGFAPGTNTASTSRPVAASRPGRVLRVPTEVLRDRSNAWFPFAGHLIAGLYHTARSIESTARQRESLVTLGTLAAGLAHEINNPASAATRAVDGLETACQALLSSLGRLAANDITAEQFAALDALRREIEPDTR